MIYRIAALSSFKKLYTPAIIRQRIIHTMGDLARSSRGLPLKEVVDALHRYADLSHAASWDNVGLLIEPTQPKIISHALLTNDLTEAVMQEAIDVNADLIISYHPPIFSPLKSVTSATWKERIVAKCLENKIALYSPHTTFDAIKGGVNDWLASAFATVMGSSTPIEQGVNAEVGMGRLCKLKSKLTIDDAVKLVKQRTNLKHVRLARACNTDGNIETIALCAGAGTTVLKDVHADLYLTGEMLHHDVLDAVHRGIHVILTNHSDSERGFLNEFAVTLTNMLNDTVKVSVATRDADPLTTV